MAATAILHSNIGLRMQSGSTTYGVAPRWERGGQQQLPCSAAPIIYFNSYLTISCRLQDDEDRGCAEKPTPYVVTPCVQRKKGDVFYFFETRPQPGSTEETTMYAFQFSSSLYSVRSTSSSSQCQLPDHMRYDRKDKKTAPVQGLSGRLKRHRRVSARGSPIPYIVRARRTILCTRILRSTSTSQHTSLITMVARHCMSRAGRRSVLTSMPTQTGYCHVSKLLWTRFCPCRARYGVRCKIASSSSRSKALCMCAVQMTSCTSNRGDTEATEPPRRPNAEPCSYDVEY